MLRFSDRKISEIADHLHFGSVSHFSLVFRRKKGSRRQRTGESSSGRSTDRIYILHFASCFVKNILICKNITVPIGYIIDREKKRADKTAKANEIMTEWRKNLCSIM